MGRPPKRKRPAGAGVTAKADRAIDTAIGRNVRVRRLAKGLSQSQLAKRLGVTFQQVQKYEKGSNRVGAGRLARIAQVLGVPAPLLLEQTDAESEASSKLALLPNARALRLAEAFNVIKDPTMRLSLVELVEKLAINETKRRR